MRFQKGQAVLIVVISLAVIITIVLSLAARSVTDLRSVSKEEEALRSYSAAEAGIEKGLITPSFGETVTITDDGALDNSTFQAQVSDLAQGSNQFSYPKEVLSGESANVWFVSHDQDGNIICNSPTLPCYRGNSIKVCWGRSGTSASDANTPAIEVSVLYDPDADTAWDDLAIARAAFDPNTSRQSGNSFSSPDSGACTISGNNYAFQKTIQLDTDLGIPAASYSSDNGLISAQVKLLYNSSQVQPVGFDTTAAGGLLPGQGKIIESTGKSGESSRKVEAYTLFPNTLSIFDSVVFSSVGIIK